MQSYKIKYLFQTIILKLSNENIHDYLGLYFRLLRKQAGLSLENISYGLSVSTSLLSDIENQRRKMKPELLIAFRCL